MSFQFSYSNPKRSSLNSKSLQLGKLSEIFTHTHVHTAQAIDIKVNTTMARYLLLSTGLILPALSD